MLITTFMIRKLADELFTNYNNTENKLRKQTYLLVLQGKVKQIVGSSLSDLPSNKYASLYQIILSHSN